MTYLYIACFIVSMFTVKLSSSLKVHTSNCKTGTVHLQNSQ